MSRKYQIASVSTSKADGTPAKVILQAAAGNLTNLFHGALWTVNGVETPFDGTAANGRTKIEAVTFDIVGSSAADGSYTVYTQTSRFDDSTFGASTEINVAEIVNAVSTGGYITNVSSYLISVVGQSDIRLRVGESAKAQVNLFGRKMSNFGEDLDQDLVNMTQHFSASTFPTVPVVGMIFHHTVQKRLFFCRAVSPAQWIELAKTDIGANSTYRHEQTPATTLWEINHGLELEAPGIAIVQFFVSTANGYKMIWPQDVSFDVLNKKITATFTNAQQGFALIRP